MKTNCLKAFVTLLSVATLAISAATVRAQDSTSPAPPALVASPTPQIGYGATQVLQLQRANVGDDTIIAYIKNSGNSYPLNADQIIYLRQQGVSSAVLSTMLSQPAMGGVPTPGPAPAVDVVAPAPGAPGDAQSVNASIVGPSVSAIDPSAAAAASYYYYPPTYYPYYGPYYYPTYGFYPAGSISIGFRGGWGGYHGGFGGFHGGGFRGGGWHR